MVDKANRIRREKEAVWVFIIACVLIYLAFHPFVTAWVGSLTKMYAPIKIWKDILLALIVIATIVLLVLRRQFKSVVWDDKLLRTISIYIFFVFVDLFVSGTYQVKAGYAGVIFDTRFLAMFWVLMVWLSRTSLDRAMPGLKKISDILVILGAIVSVIGLLQVTILPKNFFGYFGYDGINTIAPTSTVDNRPDSLRAFATLRGPNELGAYLILPITIVISRLMVREKIAYHTTIGVIMVSALILSYSRSAMLGMMAGVLTLGLLAAGRAMTRRRAALLGCIACVVIIFGGVMTVSIPKLRLLVFHSSVGDSSLIEGSTIDHAKATIDGVKDVVANPLGHGIGLAGPASFYLTSGTPRIAENYYVQIAQELGVFGLGMFLAICTLIVRELYSKSLATDTIQRAVFASFIGISVTAMLLHTWDDEPVSYTWWILAAIVISIQRSIDGPTSHKKAARTA